jgi:hypothetical protein
VNCEYPLLVIVGQLDDVTRKVSENGEHEMLDVVSPSGAGRRLLQYWVVPGPGQEPATPSRSPGARRDVQGKSDRATTAWTRHQ